MDGTAYFFHSTFRALSSSLPCMGGGLIETYGGSQTFDDVDIRQRHAHMVVRIFYSDVLRKDSRHGLYSPE